MFSDSSGSFCRSQELPYNYGHTDFSNSSVENVHTRYKILLYKKGLNHVKDRSSLNWIKILDLSGDVDQLSEEQKSEDATSVNNDSGVKGNGSNHKSNGKENDSLDSKCIQNCFKKKDGTVADNVAENGEENARIWGKLLGNIKGSWPNKPEKEELYLTVGPYVLKGNQANFREGEYYVILRKVPDHCSCVCTDASLPGETHTSHSAYYEICGIVNEKIDFKHRPNFYSSTDESHLEEYYLYLSDCKNSNWFMLKVDDEILDKILQEEAYFKIVKTGENDESKKAVLCILNSTYYIERIELAGTLMLIFSPHDLGGGADEENLLVIAGSSKYAYGLVKSNPIFESLPKLKSIETASLLKQTPISDLEIVDFILGKYEEYPCYYLYQTDGTIRYVGQYLFGEFAVRVIQVIPMYFSNNPGEKKRISELTVGDVWKMMNLYSDVFEFVPTDVFNVATVFQMLLQVSDLTETFATMEGYLGMMMSDAVYSCNVKLNLFKIQKLVSWCLVSSNYHKDMDYQSYVYHIDDILFNRAVPSYVFEELLEYVVNMEPEHANQRLLDYRSCIQFYYKNLTFSEVAALLSESGSRDGYEVKAATIFDRTGPSLFAMEELNFSGGGPLSKLPCLNYNVYRTNTKGLTNLRFGNSMNSLLGICRCPLALHIAHLSEKMVSVTEGGRCVLKIYPKVKHESLRETLSEMFKLKNSWHLEVLENKLRPFFREKPAIDILTGAPDYHGRLLITKEVNSKNYRNRNEIAEFKHETVDEWRRTKVELKPIKEESYMIINWNVPV
ncbi:conserved hypothetical protein [Theileria orientalis strain Shintoku]|uniref:Uncharacterized protein n=1 Tax=Theileria orientalis strain Shintoku TaxID=869250 RepID=J4C3C0_THEOR|nr:conserved hypothetical protein [Theileria orientalis strain Shintoku]BAM40176.1 conserved hypothetical protein [Theileria orientalis strain Shintoku]|eukprot:XP_009690477.1 conserved hypothetical protein [Theileria orientalis strain Shintoku]